MSKPILFSLILSGILVTGCESDNDAKPGGLVGYWTLTQLECFCPANSATPKEALEFDAAGNVIQYRNGQVAQTGTYQLSTGAAGCENNTNVVTFHWPSDTPKAAYSLNGDVLVIDQGLCFDAPRSTYARADLRTGN